MLTSPWLAMSATQGGATPASELVPETHQVRAPRKAENARIMMSSGPQHLGEMEGLSNLVMVAPGAGCSTTPPSSG